MITGPGGFDVFDSLATLAYDGRRSDYFRAELINALKIVDQDHIEVESMQGSWAGAMGQCQFMPTSFMKFAVDGDGDGKRDIWNDRDDAVADAYEQWYLSEHLPERLGVADPLAPGYVGTHSPSPPYLVTPQPLPANTSPAPLLGSPPSEKSAHR